MEHMYEVRIDKLYAFDDQHPRAYDLCLQEHSCSFLRQKIPLEASTVLREVEVGSLTAELDSLNLDSMEPDDSDIIAQRPIGSDEWDNLSTDSTETDEDDTITTRSSERDRRETEEFHLRTTGFMEFHRNQYLRPKRGRLSATITVNPQPQPTPLWRCRTVPG